MKTKILLAFFMLVAGLTFGQKQNIEDISVVAPKFQNEFYDSENEYFYQNAEYPSEARSARIQGISVVGFTVTENGEITEVVIKNSLSKEIAGQEPEDARKTLECQCFSPAEISEIITGCRMVKADRLTADLDEIEKQIRATIECSVRLGDRLPDEINW